MRPTSTQKPLASSRTSGFTLVELLVVVALIALLIALLLVAIDKIQVSTRSTTDLSNQRQIAVAFNSYATDHKGIWSNPRTQEKAGFLDGEVTIVENNWVCAKNNDGVMNLSNDQTEELIGSLRDGSVWEYMGANEKAYVSPQDPTDRVRSYSINAFVGTSVCPDDEWEAFQGYGPATPRITSILKPADTMLSIVEDDPKGWNWQGWLLAPTGALWHDFPAFWNEDRVNISNADGSVEQIRLADPDLPNILFDHETTQPGIDYFNFRKKLLPGIVGS